MGGNIIKYDGYDLRKYGPGDVDLFIDIGANIGTVSVMARILFPFARIHAFEPCENNYRKLVENTKYWGIRCHSAALGPGTPMCKIPHGQSGMHRFVDNDETQWWPDKIYQMANSWTVGRIMQECEIGRTNDGMGYILKIDCEGGERYILRQKEAVNLILFSLQTNIEIHMPFGGKGAEWKDFLKIFKNTHDLYLARWDIDTGKKTKDYVYELCDYGKFPRRGRVTIQLCRR